MTRPSAETPASPADLAIRVTRLQQHGHSPSHRSFRTPEATRDRREPLRFVSHLSVNFGRLWAMAQLNGWQRLWVVAAVIWGTGLALFGWSIRPQFYDTEIRTYSVKDNESGELFSVHWVTVWPAILVRSVTVGEGTNRAQAY